MIIGILVLWLLWICRLLSRRFDCIQRHPCTDEEETVLRLCPRKGSSNWPCAQEPPYVPTSAVRRGIAWQEALQLAKAPSLLRTPHTVWLQPHRGNAIRETHLATCTEFFIIISSGSSSSSSGHIVTDGQCWVLVLFLSCVAVARSLRHRVALLLIKTIMAVWMPE